MAEYGVILELIKAVGLPVALLIAFAVYHAKKIKEKDDVIGELNKSYSNDLKILAKDHSDKVDKLNSQFNTDMAVTNDRRITQYTTLLDKFYQHSQSWMDIMAEQDKTLDKILDRQDIDKILDRQSRSGVERVK